VSKNPKEFELNKQMAELPKSKFFGKLGFFVLTFKAYCIIDDITT